MYEKCPKCQSNDWSKFQTGNEKNEFFFFHKFCNECHKFSFDYKCTPFGDNIEIEKINVATEDYTIDIEYINNKTKIICSITGIDIFSIDNTINLLNFSDDYINDRIKKLIIFS
jgi:hypothetical protein